MSRDGESMPGVAAAVEIAQLRRDLARAKAQLAQLRSDRIISAVFGRHDGAPRPFSLSRPIIGGGRTFIGLGAEWPDGAVVFRHITDPVPLMVEMSIGRLVSAVRSQGEPVDVVWLSDEIEPLAKMEFERDQARADRTAALMARDLAEDRTAQLRRDLRDLVAAWDKRADLQIEQRDRDGNEHRRRRLETSASMLREAADALRRHLDQADQPEKVVGDLSKIAMAKDKTEALREQAAARQTSSPEPTVNACQVDEIGQGREYVRGVERGQLREAVLGGLRAWPHPTLRDSLADHLVQAIADAQGEMPAGQATEPTLGVGGRFRFADLPQVVFVVDGLATGVDKSSKLVIHTEDGQPWWHHRGAKP